MTYVTKAGPLVLALLLSAGSSWIAAQQGSAAGGQPPRQQFPGGTNPDGSLRPSRPVTALFTQDAYTLYEILAPGSEQFRITFMTENNRAGATEIVNATRAGSEGTDVEVFDPRTGKPMKFVYEEAGQRRPRDSRRAAVPGARRRHRPRLDLQDLQGRPHLHDERQGHRLGAQPVRLPARCRAAEGLRVRLLRRGGAGVDAARRTAQARLCQSRADRAIRSRFTRGRRRRRSSRAPTPTCSTTTSRRSTTSARRRAASFKVEQTYSESRKGATAPIDALNYLALQRSESHRPRHRQGRSPVHASGKGKAATLEVPITNDKQSAHLSVTGTVQDGSYKLVGDEIVFERTLHGLRNTVLLPAGWEVSAVSQSGTIGRTPQGRAFVALINLNAENNYKVTIRARQ